MFDRIPPELWQSFWSMVSTPVLAILGRFVWHAQLSQKGHRKFFSRHLAYELVIALGIGFFADGVMSYFGLNGQVRIAGVIGISYLGPAGLAHIVAKYGRAGGAK